VAQNNVPAGLALCGDIIRGLLTRLEYTPRINEAIVRVFKFFVL